MIHRMQEKRNICFLDQRGKKLTEKKIYKGTNLLKKNTEPRRKKRTLKRGLLLSGLIKKN